jgi:hypothetical protein
MAQSQMNLLQITDLENGHVQVSWKRGDQTRPYIHAIPFADPLDLEGRAGLRWYLEDYLMFPYGAEEYRAQKVEEKMQGWGESLFRQVFIKGEKDPDPRGFYQEAVRTGLDRCELCITSDDPAFLNIPWELMYDPTPGRGYLALSLAGTEAGPLLRRVQDDGTHPRRGRQRDAELPQEAADRAFRLVPDPRHHHEGRAGFGYCIRWSSGCHDCSEGIRVDSVHRHDGARLLRTGTPSRSLEAVPLRHGAVPAQLRAVHPAPISWGCRGIAQRVCGSGRGDHDDQGHCQRSLGRQTEDTQYVV